MKAIKYKTREEAIAAVKLAIAKKREWGSSRGKRMGRRGSC